MSPQIQTILRHSGKLLLAASISLNASAEPTKESQVELLRMKREEIAEREANIELTNAKVSLLRAKLKTQQDLIDDLNAAILKKQEELAVPDAGEEEGKPDEGSKGTLPASFLANVTPRIVIIEGNMGSGTGFLCVSEGEVWVYTAAHVLSGNSTVSVRDSKGRVYRDFEFIECAEGVDLVRLKPKDKGLEGLEMATQADAPKVGDLIVAVGNSLGAGSLSGEPGRIMNVEENMWEVDAEIIPGNSGGPILSLDSSKVVGIVTHLMIAKKQNQERPGKEVEVKRFAARLDKKWEWRKMPITRFVKEWQHIETMDRDSSIAWASSYLMLTGPEALARRDPRYQATFRTDPELVKSAEAILAKDRTHFQVQRVDEWLKRYREAGTLQRNSLIDEANKIIERNMEDIRLKQDAPKPEDFSWFHRQSFEEQIDWRKKLTNLEK